MPATVNDISNKPKKTSKQPVKKPKTGLLIGVSIAIVLAISFLVWHFVFNKSGGSTDAAAYGTPRTRAAGGANGGASSGGNASGNGKANGTSVPRGLPGDGG